MQFCDYRLQYFKAYRITAPEGIVCLSARQCVGCDLILLPLHRFSMISKTAEYALRAVVSMGSQAGSSLSADTLAEQTQVPRRYLTRVLQDLCAANIVRSRPGPGGGYELDRKPRELTILDVINTVEPIARIKQCPLGIQDHKSLCPLHAELDRAYAATEKAFASVTIQQLVESTEAGVPLCESVP